VSIEDRADSRSHRVVKTSLKHELYADIRRDIVRGAFQPGDLLRERELAARYGVSKTPVREALSLLAQEEMVKAVPRAGYMVTQLTMRDVQEVYHLRLTLEAMAARLAAERITDQELQELERLTSASNPDEAVLFNHQFHLGVARASGNSRLAKMIEQLLDDMDRWAGLDFSRFSDADLRRGHKPELDALRSGDPDMAEKVFVNHLREVHQLLLALYP
jgi:DNA-binding GntR family transcriptional regulator